MANEKYEKQLAKEAARQKKHKEKMRKIYAKIDEVAKADPKKAAKMRIRADKMNSKIAETAGDHIFNVITSIILILVTLIVGYPVIFVISASFSSTTALQAGSVILWPVDVTMGAYEFVFQFKQVWIGYRNSIFYVVTGIILTMASTILAAYPLSRKTFQGRGKYMFLFYFTTLFGAGLIPGFIVKANWLGLYDSIWAVMLAGTVSVSHIIILRTAFSSSIPGELFDAAKIDGANDFQCLTQIALPLAKATLSVLTLYIIVGAWNEYFTSMLYLTNENLYPLQLVLRPIMQATGGVYLEDAKNAGDGLEAVRYALIIISTVPPLVAYFVVQKAFKSGVMVGSVKG